MNVSNDKSNTTLYGTDAKDIIRNNSGDYVTVDAGKGDDIIYLYNDTRDYGRAKDFWYDDTRGYGIYDKLDDTKKEVVVHNEGDGNDTIYGFYVNDTLQIGDGTGAYSSQRSGSDIIVTTGEDKILLKNAYLKLIPDIDDIKTSVSTKKRVFVNTIKSANQPDDIRLKYKRTPA